MYKISPTDWNLSVLILLLEILGPIFKIIIPPLKRAVFHVCDSLGRICCLSLLRGLPFIVAAMASVPEVSGPPESAQNQVNFVIYPTSLLDLKSL